MEPTLIELGEYVPCFCFLSPREELCLNFKNEIASEPYQCSTWFGFLPVASPEEQNPIYPRAISGTWLWFILILPVTTDHSTYICVIPSHGKVLVLTGPEFSGWDTFTPGASFFVLGKQFNLLQNLGELQALSRWVSSVTSQVVPMKYVVGLGGFNYH